jgi:hypothetical protein
VNEHARRELEPPATTLSRGSLGPDVKRLQEWLCLHGFHTAVDGDFGPATDAALKAYQRDREDDAEGPGPWGVGEVNEATWWDLVRPLNMALGVGHVPLWPPAMNILSAVCAHLYAQPREVSRPNGGPWVRYYCRGQEVPWCAGFVTTVLSQALGHDEWFTISCDDLAAKAHARGLLVHELPKAWRGPEHIKPGDLFLLRRTDRWPHDWTHCGIVTAVHAEHFETIEGNTNTDGSRDGTAVHARTRAFNERTDFVLIGGDR